MNINDFIVRVRFDFNDIDHDRIDDPLIIDYLNEGIGEIFKLNPSKFLKTIVAKLDDSDLQQPCCCDLLYSVDAITDAHGNFIAELKEVDNSAQTAFGKRNCGNRTTDTRSYSKVENTDNQFTVKPPISPNESVYARMTCAVLPKINENAPLDKAIVENYASLVDYVLYRLFGAETESATSQQKSAFHYKQFLDSILLKEQVRQAFIRQGSASVKGAKK
ncbi:hypothetical protein A6B43_00210 [Vespertiliibacter pulmonis]|uniref:Uncharacterized protein n=1 Tax=Vespertiliibacter pulmonis TaxID=1443036 RepID=A0A3N4VXD4_9PAST|nr:DUF6682 family protein [Vespertiliibacter pulmonis]QLB20069.1 hypothetical protein A6B43_00210 [Vespertiliibacter pulmonis]RPE86033.1 hypothetical protein EDC46_0424 [Vespertiliibacter pulmonis]